MNAVELLDTRYLPILRHIADQLREKHPTFLIDAGSGSVRGATTLQGHHAYLEASRPNSANPEPNCVALEICVRDLPGTPTLCTLEVGWGGDGVPLAERLDLLSDDVVFTPEAVRMIDGAIPRLRDHFEHCLREWEKAYPQST